VGRDPAVDRDHQAQGSHSLGSISSAQLLFEAARSVSGVEGLRASPEIAVYPTGHRRSSAEAGHREATGSDRARAPVPTPKIAPPKEVKIWGAEEPRYVLHSPGLVENRVGLYVPLLEFNLPSEIAIVCSGRFSFDPLL
jgi:hypothetical protein